MLRIRTGSRLHFGLFNLGEGPRQFGGVGLMIDEPGIQLCMTPAREWAAEGPLSGRVLEFARRFAATLRSPDLLTPRHFLVGQAAPEHAGLGTGTQLGLATARLLAEGSPVRPRADRLALLVQRGLRSALGVHGFEHGGFLVEAGKLPESDLVSPLVARLPFPDDWRVLVAIPPHPAGLHGASEKEAFSVLAERPADESTTDSLCRLTLLGMLPAIQQLDVRAFGEALYEFNVRVGEMFAPVQGGVYSSGAVAELVTFLRGAGVAGVGQSSWGPAVFAVVGDGGKADDLAARVRERFPFGANVFVAKGMNRGALLSTEYRHAARRLFRRAASARRA
jgi:beta-ribofuranosylaminobenzene 5'-phosphate synthase